MKIKLLAFGSTREIIGQGSSEIEVFDELTVAEFRQYLNNRYEALGQLAIYAIAVNQEYVTSEADLLLHENDEVAIIPPVSGG